MCVCVRVCVCVRACACVVVVVCGGSFSSVKTKDTKSFAACKFAATILHKRTGGRKKKKKTRLASSVIGEYMKTSNPVLQFTSFSL